MEDVCVVCGCGSVSGSQVKVKSSCLACTSTCACNCGGPVEEGKALEAQPWERLKAPTQPNLTWT